jgi:hypothetical protein
MKILLIYMGMHQIDPLINQLRQHEDVTLDVIVLDLRDCDITNPIYFEQIKQRVIDAQYDLIFRADLDVYTFEISKLMQHAKQGRIPLATAIRIDSKSKYYREFQSLGIPTPKLYDSIEQAEFPCIAKPAAGTSSEGIRILGNMTQLKLFFSGKLDNQYQGGNYLLQEYIKGDVCSAVGHVHEGNVCVDFLIDIHSDSYPYAAETGFDIPSRYAGILETEMTLYLDKFFKHVGLVDGPFMLDVIVDRQGHMHLIDFGARLSKNDLLLRCYEQTDYIYKLARKLVIGTDFLLDNTLSLTYVAGSEDVVRSDRDVMTRGRFL